MRQYELINVLAGKAIHCIAKTCPTDPSTHRFDVGYNVCTYLTRFNKKIATQGAPQMAADKEANILSRVYSYYSKFNLRLFYV